MQSVDEGPSPVYICCCSPKVTCSVTRVKPRSSTPEISGCMFREANVLESMPMRDVAREPMTYFRGRKCMANLGQAPRPGTRPSAPQNNHDQRHRMESVAEGNSAAVKDKFSAIGLRQSQKLYLKKSASCLLGQSHNTGDQVQVLSIPSQGPASRFIAVQGHPEKLSVKCARGRLRTKTYIGVAICTEVRR